MDQVHVIRHKVLVEGRSARQVAREMGVSRNTVRRYLGLAEPRYGPRPPSLRPVRGRIEERVAAILADAPRLAGGKQRLTAMRIHRMLRDEGLACGVTIVKEVVAEHKRRSREVFVPLVYQPGELAQVDFFEVLVELDGQRRKAQLFVMRLMHSGRDFAWFYERADQVSFLDGHVRAFAHLGAAPQRLAYDNLRAAVSFVGTERKLAERFEALVSHYLVEASFCRVRTGHDKGGVEARGKGIRLQELVPIPSGRSLDEVSTALMARLDARMAEGKDAQGRTIGDRFDDERRHMLPLPGPFDPARVVLATASRRSLVLVEGAYYSVPCEWAGLSLTVRVGASTVEVVGRGGERVRHPRLRFGHRSIDYRHYLRELARKPQATRQVVSELVPALGAPFDEAWRALVDAHGPRDAARYFSKVLGLVEERGLDDVARSLRSALAAGGPLLLALGPKPAVEPQLQPASLPAALSSVAVESGCAADYDLWLGGAP